MNVDTGGMEDSQTITEEELTSTKQDRPKSDEIIAKVEELGQNMAPARAQEPTEGTWGCMYLAVVLALCMISLGDFGASGKFLLVFLYLYIQDMDLWILANVQRFKNWSNWRIFWYRLLIRIYYIYIQILQDKKIDQTFNIF